MTSTITISRIFAIDGVETNIAATSDNAQAALRLVETAAEHLGAAPGALPLVAAPKKQGRPMKELEAGVTAKDEAPALPAGAADAFAAAPQLPLAPPANPSEAYFSPPPPPMQAPAAPPAVSFTPDPPVPVGQSSVGLAPPVFTSPAPPPFIPPAPPPLDAKQALRAEINEIQSAMISVVSVKQPGWMETISQSMNSILAGNGGALTAASEDQLRTILDQFRSYDATIRSHLGA